VFIEVANGAHRQIVIVDIIVVDAKVRSWGVSRRADARVVYGEGARRRIKWVVDNNGLR